MNSELGNGIQVNDILNWWDHKEFQGKEHFRLDENGNVILSANHFLSERTIAQLQAENADDSLNKLIDNFNGVIARITALEQKWVLADDKRTLSEDIVAAKNFLQTADAIGDYSKFVELISGWEKAMDGLQDENLTIKTKLAEIAEGLMGSTDWKEITLAFKDIAEQWKKAGAIDPATNDALWARIEAARTTFNDRKKAAHAAQFAEGLGIWWADQQFDGKHLFKLEETGDIVMMPYQFLPERTLAHVSMETADIVLKNLSDKFNDITNRLTELEVEWIGADDKLKVADRVEHLKEFMQHVNAIGNYEKPVAVVTQWEHTINELIQENISIKTKLAEIAETYVDSTLWKEGTQAFKDINDKWKQAGYVDKTRNDQLWNRIDAARKMFNDRKRKHFDNEEKDMLQTLDLKIELAEQAEALANSTEWKATSEKYHQIIETWKTIGRTLPKKNEELWQRIMTAKNVFFDRKKVHFNVIQKEQEVNLVLKEQLVARAEALKESTEWSVTAQAFAGLMEEWKKTGRVPQEKADELWKRFIDAHEYFFEGKRKFSEGSRLQKENNYNLKSLLLKRAEEIKNSSRWGEVTVEMNRLFDEWRKIGPLPKEHSKKMWEAFIGARKHFFNRKDAHKNQRKVFMETQKSARMQQAQELVFKMQEEIGQEEERLEDLKNALDNVTPGKKANELKEHLNILISDSNAKMRRLKEKLEAGREELTFLHEKEKKERERRERHEEMDSAAAETSNESSTADEGTDDAGDEADNYSPTEEEASTEEMVMEAIETYDTVADAVATNSAPSHFEISVEAVAEVESHQQPTEHNTTEMDAPVATITVDVPVMDVADSVANQDNNTEA